MKVFTIIRKELTDQFRDKRTVLAAILMPAVLVPLLLFLVTRNPADEQMKRPVRIAIKGEVAVMQELLSGYFRETSFHYSDMPEAELAKGEAELGLVHTVKDGQEPTLTMYYDPARNVSLLAHSEISAVLDPYFSDSALLAADSPRMLSAAIRGEKENSTLVTLSMILPVFLVVFAASTTMSGAIDMSAGEKERSTIEMLLACNVSRPALILGKILASSVLGFCAVLSLVSGLVISSEIWPEITGGLSLLTFSGMGNVLCMLLVSAVSVFLFAAAGMAIGFWAKSVKEGTVLVLPVIVVSSVLAGGLVGSDPFIAQPALYAVPVINLSLLVRALVFDHLVPACLAVTVIVNLFYSCTLIFAGTWLLRKETVISRS